MSLTLEPMVIGPIFLMTRAQQTEEAYPELSNLKKELERAQREKNKANLDRDQAKLERNQANLEINQTIIERDQARRDLDLLKAEHQQEQSVRENAANCEQINSELEKIQRRQRELDMRKGARTTCGKCVAIRYQTFFSTKG